MSLFYLNSTVDSGNIGSMSISPEKKQTKNKYTLKMINILKTIILLYNIYKNTTLIIQKYTYYMTINTHNIWQLVQTIYDN